jgi:hypothetical protein
VQLDASSPYIPFVAWEAFAFRGPTAAQFSMVGVQLVQPGAVVVVDYVIVRLAAASDLLVSARSHTGVPQAAWAQRRDLENAGLTTNTTAPLTEVFTLANAAAASEASMVVPYNDAVSHQLLGPWYFGCAPNLGGALILSPSIVNTGIQAYFSGRYYPPA